MNHQKKFFVKVIELSESAINLSVFIIIIIDDVIKRFELSRDHFLLLISDAARYMCLCAKNLKLFYPNLLHTAFFVHALHNCAFKIRYYNSNVDFLISLLKGLVVKNYERKKFSHVGRAPKPIITRWGLWLDAALYYSLNFGEVFQIVDSMNNDGGVLLTRAKQQLIVIKSKTN